MSNYIEGSGIRNAPVQAQGVYPKLARRMARSRCQDGRHVMTGMFGEVEAWNIAKHVFAYESGGVRGASPTRLNLLLNTGVGSPYFARQPFEPKAAKGLQRQPVTPLEAWINGHHDTRSTHAPSLIMRDHPCMATVSPGTLCWHPARQQQSTNWAYHFGGKRSVRTETKAHK